MGPHLGPHFRAQLKPPFGTLFGPYPGTPVGPTLGPSEGPLRWRLPPRRNAPCGPPVRLHSLWRKNRCHRGLRHGRPRLQVANSHRPALSTGSFHVASPQGQQAAIRAPANAVLGSRAARASSGMANIAPRSRIAAGVAFRGASADVSQSRGP